MAGTGIWRVDGQNTAAAVFGAITSVHAIYRVTNHGPSPVFVETSAVSVSTRPKDPPLMRGKSKDMAAPSIVVSLDGASGEACGTYELLCCCCPCSSRAETDAPTKG